MKKNCRECKSRMDLSLIKIRNLPEEVYNKPIQEIKDLGYYFDIFPLLDEVDDDNYDEFLSRMDQKVKDYIPFKVKGVVTNFQQLLNIIDDYNIFISSVKVKNNNELVLKGKAFHRSYENAMKELYSVINKKNKNVIKNYDSSTIKKLDEYVSKGLEYKIQEEGIVVKSPQNLKYDIGEDSLQLYKLFKTASNQVPDFLLSYLSKAEIIKIDNNNYELRVKDLKEADKYLSQMFNEKNELTSFTLEESDKIQIFLDLEELTMDEDGVIKYNDSDSQKLYSSIMNLSVSDSIYQIIDRYHQLITTHNIRRNIKIQIEEEIDFIKFLQKLYKLYKSPIVLLGNTELEVSGECLDLKTCLGWYSIYYDRNHNKVSKLYKGNTIQEILDILNSDEEGYTIEEDDKVYGLSRYIHGDTFLPQIEDYKEEIKRSISDYHMDFINEGEFINIRIVGPDLDFSIIRIPTHHENLDIICHDYAKKWKDLSMLTPLARDLFIITGKLYNKNCISAEFFSLTKK